MQIKIESKQARQVVSSRLHRSFVRLRRSKRRLGASLHQKRLFAVSGIQQNRNWLYFNFSVESSSFIFNNFKTEKFKLTFKGCHRPVCHFGFTRVSSSKHRHARRARVIFLNSKVMKIGVFKRLFTVII